jgi:APA family basic amino acid/polyamine antiporter
MLLKAAAIVALVMVGLWLGGGEIHPRPARDRPVSFDVAKAIGAAMIQVAFAYGGWQTASFAIGEMRRPGRDLPRGLVAGVIGVIALYV